MTKKDVFQTLENRGNPDEIEQWGPYLCNNKNAWLGDGYYFWDTFIANAHWWGAEGANYTNGYIICKAECDFSPNVCLDLVGETLHIEQFNMTIKLMKEKGLLKASTTVARVINFLKNNPGVFSFEAIRAYGLKSKSFHSRYNSYLYFNPTKGQYLDLSPAIQICFFRKNSMNLTNYKIIYPDAYIDGYAV